jgi:hypothetical protein
MIGRAKNTATAADVARVLRGGVASLEDEKYLTTDLDKIVEIYEPVIMDLLRLTPRPTAGVLKLGSASAFSEKNTDAECYAFGEKLYNAIVMCREKSKSMSTGKKLSDPVRKVCQFMLSGGAVSTKAIEIPRSNSFVSTSSSEVFSKKPAVAKWKSQELCEDKVKEDILAMYGLKKQPLPMGPPSAFSAVSSKDVLEIASSQECSPAKVKPSRDFLQHLDTEKRCLVRSFPTGQTVFASMSPGAKGFAVAYFPGEQESFDTEMPNAMLSIVPAAVMKRPAAPLSRKLVKQARKAAKVEEELFDDEEDGEPEETIELGNQPVEEEVPATQEYPNQDADSVAEDAEPFDESLYSNRKVAFDKDGQIVSWKQRLQSRPLGCVKCRAAPGCSPSCWIKK